MANEREPMLMIACGTKGVGKTYRTILEIKKYIKNGRKALVFDVNFPAEQSYAQAGFKTVNIENLDKLTAIQCRRVLPLHKDTKPYTIGDKLEACEKLLTGYYNGLLVLEDINNYMLGAKTQGVIGAITTNRHRGQDIIIHLQSLSALDPRLWQNVTVIRFHKQNDNIDRYKDRIPNYEIMKLAQFMVDEQYRLENRHWFCYVNIPENKIFGITKAQFRAACTKFLQLPFNRNELNEIYLEIGIKILKNDKFEQAVTEFMRRRQHYVTFEI